MPIKDEINKCNTWLQEHAEQTTEQQATVARLYWLGYTQVEIGAILGINSKKIHWILRKIKKKQ